MRSSPVNGRSYQDEDPADPEQTYALPHDGIEPLRRLVRWVVDQSVEPAPRRDADA